MEEPADEPEEMGKEAQHEDSDDGNDANSAADSNEEQSTSCNKRKHDGEDTPAKKSREEEVVSFYVGGLSSSWNSNNLRNIFESRGIELVDARKSGNKRYGHVDLKNPADADKAAELNGLEIDCFVLKVDRAVARQKEDVADPAAGKDDTNSTALFIKEISLFTTEWTLKEFFEGCKAVRINKRGFAFVEYETTEQATQAMEEKQGRRLDGITLVIHKSYGKETVPECKTLFVRNISLETSEEDLEGLFTTASNIRRPAYSDSGDPKTFAFIDFPTVAEAKEALKVHQGATLSGKELQIDFDTASNPGEPKRDKRQRYREFLERSRGRRGRGRGQEWRYDRGHGNPYRSEGDGWRGGRGRPRHRKDRGHNDNSDWDEQWRERIKWL